MMRKLSVAPSLCGLVALGILVVLAVPAASYVTSAPEKPDIDGTAITVGIAVAKWLAGLIPYPSVSVLVTDIITAFEPRPEDDYWSHVHEQVEKVCGQYINEHNIDQVLVYKNDLTALLSKYQRATTVSDGTYPDKNTVADAITTSIIANRYLVEATDMPWSMILHFVDISSAHIVVLKDAAESYSELGVAPSRWWVDLRDQLQHYIDYGLWLETQVVTWRNSQIECQFDGASGFCLAFNWLVDCYDEYKVIDHVSSYVEDCDQLHAGDGAVGSCSSFCTMYQRALDRELATWLYKYVGSVIQEWEKLKMVADEMSSNASR
ncbi:uncharacterized protein LOC143034510 isoform X2 [Oratosquilla oratoria]